VSTAISNSININMQIIKSMRRVSTASAQSIFKQYTKRQHPMNAKLTSVHSASTSMRRVAKFGEQIIIMQSIQCL